MLKLTFEKCDDSIPENECHPDEVITTWLKRKFIIVLQNQERFQTTEYNEDRVVKESKLIYYPIDSLMRKEYAQNVQITDLQLQDTMYI